MEETVTPSYLLSLPYELQQQIAMELDVQSALNLCLGAKALETAICKDDGFWREKYRRDFDTKKVFEDLDWFENYRIKARGTMNFKYDTDNDIIYVKMGDRDFTTIPNVDLEDSPRGGFLDLFLRGLSPGDILEQLDKGSSLPLSYEADLEKNTHLPEAGEFVIAIRPPDSDKASSFIYLTRREAQDLISTLYEDFYIAFYM